MNDEQAKAIQWWTYLLKGKDESHLRAWYKDILKSKGYREAETFKKNVNEINGKEIMQ